MHLFLFLFLVPFDMLVFGTNRDCFGMPAHCPDSKFGVSTSKLNKNMSDILKELFTDIIQNNNKKLDIDKKKLDIYNKNIEIAEIKLNGPKYIQVINDVLLNKENIRVAIFIGEVSNSLVENNTQLNEWRKGITTQLLVKMENMLLDFFGENNNFFLIDRMVVDDIVKETKLAHLGLISESSAIDIVESEPDGIGSRAKKHFDIIQNDFHRMGAIQSHFFFFLAHLESGHAFL